MINLIPPKAKKSIVTEYWVRVSSTWSYLWAFTFICSAAIVFPAYISVSSQVSVYEESAQQASAKVADYKSAATGLVRSSQQASVVVNESRLPDFSDYIALFEDLQGSQVSIERISISRSVDGIKPVQIVGTAFDRQSLASFRDRLLAESIVDEVDLPISNLAQDSDIQFSLLLVINSENNL